jgi:MFS transporter, DHA1 family, inner membrane transport protein
MKAESVKPGIRAQVVLFALVRLIVNANTRMIYPFLTTFSQGLGVDIAAISLAVVGRSFSGALSPLITPVADRRSRKAGMLAGLGIFTAGAGLMVVWPTYIAFFISLSLTFLGMYVYLSSTHAYIGDHIRAERRGLAMALVEFGWALSFVLGMPLLGWLIGRFGWQAPFPLFTGLGALALLLIAMLVPNLKPPQTSSRNTLESLKQVLRIPAARYGLAMSLLVVASNEVINLVFGVWLEQSFGLKLAALGAASALIGISELSGESLGGALSDRLGRKRTVMIGMGLIAMVAAALPFISSSKFGALAGLFFFYLAFEFTFVSTLPLMTELVPEARGTLLGVNVAVISLGRMVGNLAATLVFTIGFWANSLVAVILVTGAYFMLRMIKVPKPVIQTL